MSQDVIALVPYNTSLVALAVLCISVLVQTILTAPLALAAGKETPGRPLNGTYADFSFRVMRTHANSVESLPAFTIALGLSIVAGIDPFWVNGLATLHVVFRMFYWWLYYAGIGANAPGPRTLAFSGAWLSNIVLVVWALLALIVGS